MASSLPILVHPRTPTPPPDGDDDNKNSDDGAVGLGLMDGEQPSPTKLAFPSHADTLSPLSATFPPPYQHSHPFGSMATPLPPYQTPLSPARSSFATPMVGNSNGNDNGNEAETPVIGGSSENVRNPFNFQTVTYTAGRSPVTKSDVAVGRRRGHKYKHSSVSHQIFLEPPPRAPLQLPASLPIPTWTEYRRSMSREQTWRGLWCCCHLAVSAFVSFSAGDSLALTVLSRLLFFDALGAFLCVAVDVGSNFEVWKRSSIRHPFGFERAEVVAGLAMSVGLLFMGLDLISHGLTHALENRGGHASHHPHEHDRVSPGSVDLAALAAIISTLVSALVLRNHARIGRVMRFGYLADRLDLLPGLLANPAHLLTLSCSTLLLLLPLLSLRLYRWLDRALSAAVALAMLSLGCRLGWALGRMLMMSAPPSSLLPSPADPAGPSPLDALLADVRADPAVAALDDARFWQVHYGLCQANLKLRLRAPPSAGLTAVDPNSDVARLRARIARLVRNRLGGGYGKGAGGQRWEVSAQVTLERD